MDIAENAAHGFGYIVERVLLDMLRDLMIHRFKLIIISAYRTTSTHKV